MRTECERTGRGSFVITGMGRLACSPSDLHTLARDLQLSEISNWTRVWPPKGCKQKGGGGKGPYEGPEGKSLTLSGKVGGAGAPWGFRSWLRSQLGRK